MKEKTIRVAIVCKDLAGEEYELVKSTFAENEIFELCTPIVYVVSGQTDASDKPAEHARLTVVPNATGEKLREDAAAGVFDVMVLFPSEKKRGASTLSMLLNNERRPALAVADWQQTEGSETAVPEWITEKATLLHLTLRRDLRVSIPRIAVISRSGATAEEQQQLRNAVKMLIEKHVNAFGPYQTEDFIDYDCYEHFDAALLFDRHQAMAILSEIEGESMVEYAAGQSPVVTYPLTVARENEVRRMDETALRRAIFTAVDICRNRVEYDKPLANPLKKLFHERRDDSEKVRFNVPKGKPQTEKGEEKTEA